MELAPILDPDDDQDAYSSTPSEYITPSTVPGRQTPVMEVAVPRPLPVLPDILPLPPRHTTIHTVVQVKDSNISINACIYQPQILRGRADTEMEVIIKTRLQDWILGIKC